MLSVVVPVYNEEANLAEVRARVTRMLDGVGFDRSEVLFVSDGSSDGSERMIAEFARADPRLRGIFLTRNFGHQAAVSVGLERARGSVVTVIDGDLQDPPEHIPALIAALEDGADVAYGVRRKRKEPAFKRAGYWLFYRLLRMISSTNVPLDAGDYACMTRRVVDAMKSLPETRRFVRGLRAWVGYRQVGVEYERHQRFAGTPKYTLSGLLRLAYDGIFAFSGVPVKLMQIVGFVAASGAALVGLVYLIISLLVATPPGFPTIMLSIWLLGGVQLFAFGLLGEYVFRTYEEARRRPSAMVREVVSFDE